VIEPPPKRRARPNRKRRIELAAQARIDKEKRKALRAQQTIARREAAAAALAAAEAAKVEKAKKELSTYDSAKAELLRTLRPQSVTDYCRSRGIDPDTVPWHPRYNIPGVPPEHSTQAV